MKRFLMVIALVAGSVAGCSLFGHDEGARGSLGYIVFDSYTQDTTFGFELDGIYVDEDGLVWRYHGDEPWFPEELRLGMVSESDLLKKTEGAKRVGSVNPQVLGEMIELIEPASKGEVVREMQSSVSQPGTDVAITVTGVRRACSGSANVSDVFEADITGAQDLSVAIAEVDFDAGSSMEVLVRRIRGTDRFVGRMAWPAEASVARVSVRPLGSARATAVTGAIATGRAPLTSLVVAMAQQAEQARKKYNETRNRAKGSDHIKTMVIPE